jgi:hypothetical protein
VFSDPMTVTYNGSGLTLPRTGMSGNQSFYTTADREFELYISSPKNPRNDMLAASITLARKLVDPTPANAFDAYRDVRNAFGLSYAFDLTRAETSVDIPRLRTALLALVDSTFQGRLIAGEK